MRIALFLLFVITLTVLTKISPAQEELIKIHTLPAVDTAFIDTLLSRARQFQSDSSSLSLEYSDSAINLSFAAHYSYGVAHGLVVKAYALKEEKAYLVSQQTFFEALALARKTSSIEPALIAQIYNSIGGLYQMQGYTDSALQYIFMGYSEYLKKGIYNQRLLGSIYSNTAACMLSFGDIESFEWYIKRALYLARRTNSTGLLTSIYGNISYAWKMSGNLSKSIQYASMNVQLFKSLGNLRKVQTALCDIAGVYFMQDDTLRAAQYLDSAVSLYPEGMQNNTILLQRLARLHYLRGDYRTAIRHSQSALSLNNLEGGRPLNLNVYYLLTDIYTHMGNYREALKWSIAYADLNDSIFNEAVMRISGEMEVKYRLNEKNQELLNKQQQLDLNKLRLKQKNIWIGAIALSSCSLILFVIFSYRTKQKLQQEKIRNAERNRIARDLHDGIGALLSAIKMNYILIGKSPSLSQTETFRDGMELIDEMRDELRAIAYNLLSDNITHRDLGDAIRMLCHKLQKNYSHIHMHIQVLGDIYIDNADLFTTLYRIAEEVIHNSLKHSGCTEILVQVMQHDQLIRITIEDNGKGFDVHATEMSTRGMGLKNIRERVRQYKGTVQIISGDGQGTSVELAIPCKHKKMHS